MRRLLCSGAAVLLFAATGFAATFSGIVIDSNCKSRDAATHTKACAERCARSGFGLVTADGKFLKFDEAGNAKALAALKATPKDKDLKATVTGTAEGDMIKVASIRIL